MAAACTSGESTPPTTTSAPPIETTLEPTTTARPTTSGVPRTTTTQPVEILSGNARISGTVLGPQGPVVGAIVRVERLVGSEVATMDVAAPTGSYSLVGIRGGRYRVRAWKTPDLVQLEPAVFFLTADENRTVDLSLTRVSEVSVQTTVEPDPPPPAEPFAITVFLYAGVVSDQGVVQANPRAGQQVQILLGPGLALVSGDRSVTDAAGRVGFAARGLGPGPQSADLALSDALRVPLNLPPCRA